MPKRPIPSALVTLDGVEQDWQTDRRYHGGRDRAICLFSIELYGWLNRELDLELSPGDLGENFTTAGFDLDALKPCDQLEVGQCVIQIVNVREPCSKLKRWHPKLTKFIAGHSGWMAKVIQPGKVTVDDAIVIVGR